MNRVDDRIEQDKGLDAVDRYNNMLTLARELEAEREAIYKRGLQIGAGTARHDARGKDELAKRRAELPPTSPQ